MIQILVRLNQIQKCIFSVCTVARYLFMAHPIRIYDEETYINYGNLSYL